MNNNLGLVNITVDGKVFFHPQENTWIKVSDELPQYPFLCLVTIHPRDAVHAVITIAYYENKYWRYSAHTICEGVFAWTVLQSPAV